MGGRRILLEVAVTADRGGAGRLGALRTSAELWAVTVYVGNFDHVRPTYLVGFDLQNLSHAAALFGTWRVAHGDNRLDNPSVKPGFLDKLVP
jgi:hypothetical protein